MTDSDVAHAIYCKEENCGTCDGVSQADLAIAARELLQHIDETTSSQCDTYEMAGERRYWCSTHSESGRMGGCTGELGRKLLKKYGVRT